MAELINKEETVAKGHILCVSNTKKAKLSNAKDQYFVIHCESMGEEFPIMLTKRELDVAINRAKKNPEDIPQKSWLRDLFD